MRATNAKPVEKDAAVLLWVRRKDGKRGWHMIYAVDFDGTLCTNAWPDIGEPPIRNLIHAFYQFESMRAQTIMNTCREGGGLLDKAKILVCQTWPCVPRCVQ